MGRRQAAVITLGDEFQELLALINRFEIPYLIGGSVASGSHGMARQTNDIDILVDFRGVDVEGFLKELLKGFYADADTFRESVRTGRSFNAIHAKGIYKFDIFPAGSDEFMLSELDRRRYIFSAMPGLENIEFPVASPEDTVLAKLVWFPKAGEISERQCGDIWGILQVQATRLDAAFMTEWERKLGVSDLLERARREAE